MVQSSSLGRDKLETNIESKRALTRPGFWKKLASGLAGMALALAGCLSLQAQDDLPSFSSFQLQGLFSEHHFISAGPASYMLSLAAEPSALSHQPLHLIETCHLSSFFKKVNGEDDLEADSSVTLFRKSMPSRFSYHSWAGLRTGWGQYFSAETFGRSRTNGVGLNEPDFIYVKMSVRF